MPGDELSPDGGESLRNTEPDHPGLPTVDQHPQASPRSPTRSGEPMVPGGSHRTTPRHVDTPTPTGATQEMIEMHVTDGEHAP
eukprot:gene4527-15857_t